MHVFFVFLRAWAPFGREKSDSRMTFVPLLLFFSFPFPPWVFLLGTPENLLYGGLVLPLSIFLPPFFFVVFLCPYV